MRPRPCLIPPPTPHDDSLQRGRRPTRILLLRALILSLVIVIQILHYRWAMAAVSGVALGVFVLSTFVRRLCLCAQHRAAILIVTFLALGMLGLRTFGLYGLSPSLLVAAVALAASWLFVYQYCDGALVCVTESVALNFTPARCGKRAADARHQTAP
jgi:hypothetical protein